MQAFTISGYKQPLQLTTVSEPTPGPDEVLVNITASSVNMIDEKIRLGELKAMLAYPMPLTLGHDLAGTVEAVGTNVTRFSPGDRVFARVRDLHIGTFAEKIAAHQDDLALSPGNISDAEAASLPLVALTAWQALVTRGRVQAGHKVLIHAGAGGVGTIAIQLAKHLGAYVATTASAKNADFLRELGADEVIDYRSQNFEEELSGYDFVLDSLGTASVAASLTVLRPGGKVIGITGPMTPAIAQQANANVLVRGVFAGMAFSTQRKAKKLGVSYEALFMTASGEELAAIARLVEDGVIRPVIAQEFSFDQTPQALDAATGPSKPGKIVIQGVAR